MSYAYMIGDISLTASYINRHLERDALDLINSKTKSGGKEMPGLVKRRQREVALYMHAKY